MTGTGWIGVDLDGTLAISDGWHGLDHIGEPVPAMLARVQRWLKAGVEVRILTARVADPEQAAEARWIITKWCLTHVGTALLVTCEKDHRMTELWDDRAVAVEKNTGRYRRAPLGTGRSGQPSPQIPGQLSIDDGAPERGQ